jgi:hypothetical protein
LSFIGFSGSERTGGGEEVPVLSDHEEDKGVEENSRNYASSM